MRTSFHEDHPAGTVKAQEYHEDVQTNAYGIFNIAIGSISPAFPNINWNLHQYYLQIEIDQTGTADGDSYIDLGTSQILSVPYAIYANQTRRWINDDPVIQSGAIGSGAILESPGSGARLIWYPRKAAFRTGTYISSDLDDNKMGIGSFASGNRNIASGDNSTALCFNSKANGKNSIAIGTDLIVNAGNGIALGSGNSRVNTPQDPAASRIFEVGYGDAADGKNAITVYNTGDVGIGNNCLSPQYRLDIGGRVRIKHHNETAGIHFNSSTNSLAGFVGMKTDEQVGFFIGGEWRFWVNAQGNGFLNGNIIQTSDRRLKRDFSPVTNSLSKLSNLVGQHYFWKDSTKSQTLQTGLIAQEVEQYFPELVSTDEKGYKAVNYVGLIPHLIESVKTLKVKTDEIEKLQKQLSVMQNLQAQLDELRSELRAQVSNNQTKLTTSSK